MEWIFIIGFIWIISSYLYNKSTFKEDGTEHLEYLKEQLKEKQYEARTDKSLHKEQSKPKTNLVYSYIQDLLPTKKLMYISAEAKAKYLKSKRWKALKLFKLKIAQNKCECCGSTTELHLHHIDYERLTEELIEDVVIVCSICHQKIHDKLGYDRVTKYPISAIKD